MHETHSHVRAIPEARENRTQYIKDTTVRVSSDIVHGASLVCTQLQQRSTDNRWLKTSQKNGAKRVGFRKLFELDEPQVHVTREAHAYLTIGEPAIDHRKLHLLVMRISSLCAMLSNYQG